MPGPVLDEEALVAGIDLVGRAGAKHVEVGYLHDDVPLDEAAWYAHAQYRGARIIVENMAGPVEAVEALAVRILTGGKCRCGKLVTLTGNGAWFPRSDGGPVDMADGTSWTADDARAAGQCHWTRVGPKWIGACGAGQDPTLSSAPPPPGPNRAERRKRKR